MRWRGRIPTLTAARLFPALSPDELRELSADIAQHGLRSPVTLLKPVDGSPQLLDGRNRLDAVELAGLPMVDADGNLIIEHVVIEETSGFDPFAFVVSANLHRRHLTREQKREVIATLLCDQPSRSDHATAQIAKADHHTVASVRSELEGRWEIPHVAERVDTRGRSQPATKSTRSSAPVSANEAERLRRQAVLGFTTVLHEQAPQTLEVLVKLPGNERRQIVTLPLEKRVALARGYLRALGVAPDDLQA
ncbi:MAG: ParB N-terminal domain-containing protein [Alphaproteobacteria bacterium]|nr:ParB N-terminal domain-containing protein [Alphaproteobacteria bacterium]